MANSKQQRKKTFTGCWTCRFRRVKCDEQVPSCQRCILFGVDCEGYGVRLTWILSDGEGQFQQETEGPTDDAHGSRVRRSMRHFENLEAWAAPQCTEMELDAMLERVDQCPVGSSRSEGRLFSVFSSQPPVSSRFATSRLDLTFLDTPTTTSISVQRAGHDKDTLIPIHENSRPDHFQSFLDGSNAMLPNHARCSGTRNQQQGSSTAYTCREALPKPRRHLDCLLWPSRQKRLIHHWVTFTSVKLALVDEPYNPCRSMMLPMALKGAMSTEFESTADVAVFHAICAGAAYNLYELSGRSNEQDKADAWRHNDDAISHLRRNLVRPDQYFTKSLGMAIMACIMVEAISGTPGRWRTHLDGGIAYLRQLRESVVGMQIATEFQVRLIPMAILCGYDVPDEFKSFLLVDAEELDFHFPYYGISKSLLRNLVRIKDLEVEQDPDISELDRFELQLYLDFPQLEDNPSSKEHIGIFYSVKQTFYYALLVYYQRSIRQAPIEQVQPLIEKGIAQLELIEKDSQDTAGSVMMWAPLILGTECSDPVLQRRISAWFQKKQRLGMRNVFVIDNMLRELWKERSHGDLGLRWGWKDFMNQKEFDVFRL